MVILVSFSSLQNRKGFQQGGPRHSKKNYSFWKNALCKSLQDKHDFLNIKKKSESFVNGNLHLLEPQEFAINE